MGTGIATLLRKYLYTVVTNLDGLSATTQARLELLGVEFLTLPELLHEASIFLSVLPLFGADDLGKLPALVISEGFCHRSC